MFTALAAKALREEVAANEGDIELLDSEVAALNDLSVGIDENHRSISGMGSALTDAGYLDSGDFLTNLANGAVFFNGARMDAQAFILGLVAMKSGRITPEVDRDDEDFADWFMTEADPAKVVIGRRICTTTEECAVRDSDGDAFVVVNGAFEQAAATNGYWPSATVVDVKTVLKVSPDLDSLLKVAGSFGIMTFKQWYTTALPLFSEKLGTLLGLPNGVDFSADVSTD
jgi:hypothetical protein